MFSQNNTWCQISIQYGGHGNYIHILNMKDGCHHETASTYMYFLVTCTVAVWPWHYTLYESKFPPIPPFQIHNCICLDHRDVQHDHGMNTRSTLNYSVPHFVQILCFDGILQVLFRNFQKLHNWQLSFSRLSFGLSCDSVRPCRHDLYLFQCQQLASEHNRPMCTQNKLVSTLYIMFTPNY